MFGKLKKGSSSKTLEVHHNFRKVSTMNYPILYQWEEEIASQCKTLNTWQVSNVALFSQGVMKAQSSQQQAIARQVKCGERVDSAARRLRRFIANKEFPLAGFFGDLTRWVMGRNTPAPHRSSCRTSSRTGTAERRSTSQLQNDSPTTDCWSRRTLQRTPRTGTTLCS